MNSKPLKIGILTTSDRAHKGEYEDRGGPAIRDYLNKVLTCPWQEVAEIVPDENKQIQAALRRMVDGQGCSLVVTTGGTGPAVRDVTPEATLAVCEKEMPGFGELMRAVSLKVVPTAILSRQTAGIRGRSLIVNLPGKPSAIEDCLSAVMPAIPYCIDLMDGPFITCHEEQVQVFRPKQG